MTFTPEFMLQIIVALGSGFGVYSAIRADLATLHERTKNLQADVDRAHKRISQAIDN